MKEPMTLEQAARGNRMTPLDFVRRPIPGATQHPVESPAERAGKPDPNPDTEQENRHE